MWAGMAALALSGSTQAASNTWIASSNGNWNAPGNWSGGVNIPGGTGTTNNLDTATFNTSTGVTVTVDTGRNLQNLSFDTSAGSFTLSGGSLVLTSGGTTQITAGLLGTGQTETINSALTLAAFGVTYTFANNNADSTNVLKFGTAATITDNQSAGTNTLLLTGANAGNNTVAGVISNGTGTNKIALSKTGAGKWILSGANSYTGGTAITGGTLTAGNTAALGATGAAVSLAVGTTLDLATDTSVNAYNVTIGNLVGSATIASNKATSGTAGITHTLGTLSIGAGTGTTLNIVAGGNVTGGSPAIAFGATTLTQTAGASSTFNPTTANVTLASVTTLATATHTNILVLDGTSTGNSVAGTIDNGVAGGLLGVTKSNTSTWTLSGANTYTGVTSANLGTLVLSNNGTTGSLGATAVTVGSGATPVGTTSGHATLQVNGNYTIGTATGGTLTIKGGNTGGTPLGRGTLSLVDGTANTLTLANNTAGATTFTIGSNTNGNNSILNLEVGATADQISLAASAKISIGTSTTANVVNLTGLGNLSGTTQTLINSPGGITAGAFTNFSLGTTSGNFGGYTVALSTAVANKLNLTETANAAAANAFWKGTNDGVWNTFSGGNTNISNFASDAGGTNATGLVGPNTNVTFNATSSANSTATTLGQNFTINSLTFGSTASSPVGIGGSNTLTVNAAAVNGNALGNGITVQTGSGNHTLSTKVALGGNQTWTVTDSGTTLSASNQISGAFSLAKAGSGTLALSGANLYTGGTTVTAGNLKANNLTGSATGTGAVNIQSGAYLSGGNATGGTTSPGGASLGIYASGVQGLITGPLTIESGAHLAPGNSVGTLTTASLTFNLGSILDYEFNGTANDFTSATTLTLNGGAFNLYQEGTTTAFTSAGTYDLFSYGTLAGTGLGSLSVLNPQAGFAYTFLNDSTDQLIQLQIAVVPEPGTWALMLGGFAMLVGLQKFRKRA